MTGSEVGDASQVQGSLEGTTSRAGWDEGTTSRWQVGHCPASSRAPDELREN